MKRLTQSTRRMLATTAALALLLLAAATTTAQETEQQSTPTQTVKGEVMNLQTGAPVAGATVAVAGTTLGGISRPDGSFRIEQVPVGRHVVRVSSVGFQPITTDIIVTSGRQVVLSFQLQESVMQSKELVVTANSDDPFKPINEAALVSADAFTVDEVSRYAGARDDPARMAQNFAGVLGSTGLRNDIVIRGGSPTELLWRIDGIEIPNPNHFATQGGTGGPVNAINTNLLANSDFLTGAFPAEYGGRLSGVFDLRTRRGNDERYEAVAQMGFAGFEGMIEGPVPAGAFIASYRRSTLQVFDGLSIPIGIDAVPKYWDGMAKIDLTPTDRDQISLMALAGVSDIDLFASDDDSVFTGDQDIVSGSDLAVVGAQWRHLFSETVVGKLTLSHVFTGYQLRVDSLTTNGESEVLNSTRWMNDNSSERYLSAKMEFTVVPSPSHYLTAGAEGRSLGFALDRQRYTPNVNGEQARIKDDGSTGQALGYFNWNWRPTDELSLNAGVFGQYLGISQKSSIEPRLSLAWQLQPGQSVSAGVGVHRQAQALPVYFYPDDNRSLDFTEATHYVLGYSSTIAQNWLVKAETYWKQLGHVPVSRDSATSYSLLNQGASFNTIGASERLTSEGKGRSYGAELTLRRRFVEGWYVTATASLFRQEYAGSDGVWRNGAFDNRYILNLLAGYEWKISSGFTVEFGGKFTLAGGAPYTPIDLATSRLIHATYLDDGRRYAERNSDYARLDLRTDFRQNFGGWSLIGFVSVENVTNRKNIQERQYDPLRDQVEIVHQTGLLPIGGFRIEF
ncbi:MAG: TonB-dependent receptor [Chlorobi bacterium]|nr:TonB-dependent receptor [Chlorobiota bacterium]